MNTQIDGNQIKDGAIDLDTKVTDTLPIANGGTAAANSSDARINLGLQIGVDVEAYSPDIVSNASTSTDNAIARFDGAGGKTIQNSVGTIDDSGNTTLTSLTLDATGTGITSNGNADLQFSNSGGDGYGFNFTSSNGTSSGSGGGGFSVQSGNASSTGNGLGGLVDISAGNGHGSGHGGEIDISGGTGGATNGVGGSVSLQGGSGSGSGNGGGSSIIGGGSLGTGVGGSSTTQGGVGGATSGSGGPAQLFGGAAVGGDSNGGDAIIAGGQKHGAGVNGKIRLLDHVSASIAGILDVSSITSTDKTFTFPNKSGTFVLADLTSITAANDLTLTGFQNIVGGNTQVNAITTASWASGSIVTLVFTGSPTVKHNTAGGAGTATLLLSGGVDLTASNPTVLTLMYDGTNWQEVSRSINHA